MFDYLKCEYPLPVPKELENDSDFSIEETEFQTHSFEFPCMDEYEISDDGQLYRWSIDRRIENENGKLNFKEDRRELSKVDHTGEVFFRCLHIAENKDYLIEYKVLFWKGDLKEAYLEDVDVQDNKKRIQAQEQLFSYADKAKRKRKKWWFPFYRGLRYVVAFFTFGTRWLLGWVIKLTWKIDRWTS